MTLLFSALLLTQSSWDLERLSKPPPVHDAPDVKADGVRAIFYDGIPWKGNPTRVFAWLGTPAEEGKRPAMVLLHGGGGTAFSSWVRLWTSRGYVAIAMDLCGSVPGKDGRKRKRHDAGGPPGWGGFDQVDWEEKDQWTHHAVADVFLANSLLRSMAEVDPDRIGLTGISWGGYLTCIAAGVDPRFAFAAPVYGCGYLGEDSAWLDQFKKMGDEKAGKWLRLWDPSSYLAGAKKPMLWMNGTNDFAYPLGSWRKSCRLAPGPRTLSVRVRMPHNHRAGQIPGEIHAFAESLFAGGPGLARVTGQGVKDGRAWATFESAVPVARAEINSTADSGRWQKRTWRSAGAVVSPGRVTAVVPGGATAWYFNLVDLRGLVVSTEHVAE